ncbi:MAG TPA: putative lipid II flippase FtsW [Acidimicrobiia bacterium]|jgi:cell division protein FtsW|nr:putative lipid II flippase FtsW [Acidimicrobiia bacterium]
MTTITPRVTFERLARSNAVTRVTDRLATRPRLPRPPAFIVVCATVGVLNIVGLVMIMSASSVAALSDYGSAWYFFERQLLWAALGGVAFVIAARVDYRRWRKASPFVCAATVALLVAVLAVGDNVYGSRRWLGIGSYGVQPSELAKLAMVVCAAQVLSVRADRLTDSRAWRPVLVLLFVFAVLVMKEPDLTSTIVLAVITFGALVVAGVRNADLIKLSAYALAGTVLLAMAAPYRRSRMLGFLHPSGDPANSTYQIRQSLIAVGSGGLNGVGLGAGRAKWLFLPNAHTDFIFAIVGEELGFVGALLVLGLFAGFGLVGFRVALRAPDRFGTIVAAGVTAWITGEAVINLGAVLGVLPVSGVPLPFLSVGGSSLVITMIGAGVLANIARQTVSEPRERVQSRSS